MITIDLILANAQRALFIAQSFPITEPRIALTIQLLSGTIGLLQSLSAKGVFTGQQAIEVDEIGVALLANIQAQLDQLAAPAPEARA